MVAQGEYVAIVAWFFIFGVVGSCVVCTSKSVNMGAVIAIYMSPVVNLILCGIMFIFMDYLSNRHQGLTIAVVVMIILNVVCSISSCIVHEHMYWKSTREQNNKTLEVTDEV